MPSDQDFWAAALVALGRRPRPPAGEEAAGANLAPSPALSQELPAAGRRRERATEISFELRAEEVRTAGLEWASSLAGSRGLGRPAPGSRLTVTAVAPPSVPEAGPPAGKERDAASEDQEVEVGGCAAASAAADVPRPVFPSRCTAAPRTRGSASFASAAEAAEEEPRWKRLKTRPAADVGGGDRRPTPRLSCDWRHLDAPKADPWVYCF
eukprot:TRINITY_DN29226_c0_g1_i1.p1 TRINITY_DN29226_c0_g1~~TRINITY_DN29226_c0_g1_i1.p1  ORF type:complete len:242 (-),score=34.03 TRINITY_DN29226_c0_g1_i1:345-974(-)